jgi:hypothetical protein
MEVFTAAALIIKRSATEDAASCLATACADCAASMDGLTVTEIEAALAMLPEVTEECTTTAFPEDSIAVASYAVLTLAMRLLLVRVDRLPLIDTDEDGSFNHPVPGGHDSLRLELRTAVADTLLLCQSAGAEVLSYPEGHLFYRRSPSVERIKERDQLLRGLCCAAVGCYTHYLPLMESYIPLPGIRRRATAAITS